MTVPVIIGAGLAGLSVALSLAPMPVIVIGRKLAPGLTSTSLAQGGIAACLSSEDSFASHVEDTINAGVGLCDPKIVSEIVRAAPQAIERLVEWGVNFDRKPDGSLALGLEGAHACRRIVHASGDSTGAIVMKALVEKAKKTPSIKIMDNVEALKLMTNNKGHISGVLYRQKEHDDFGILRTHQIVLATGSVCALWEHTTVPLGSWGHGLALAAGVGTRFRDLEFVQFHPTALDVGCDPMPLVSEAVRGEGGKLVLEDGSRFVEELAPRDVVSRAIWMQFEQGNNVYLDLRHMSDFGNRFPTISGFLKSAEFDPGAQFIPIRPVAHYHMGGIATDSSGRTSVPGLWACGECASTGLHGANRLASNSLLEAAVTGHNIAEDMKPDLSEDGEIDFEDISSDVEARIPRDDVKSILQIRADVGRYLGLYRSRKGLELLLDILADQTKHSPRALVASLLAKAALAREESRGGHQRIDFPETREDMARPFYVKYENEQVKIEG